MALLSIDCVSFSTFDLTKRTSLDQMSNFFPKGIVKVIFMFGNIIVIIKLIH